MKMNTIMEVATMKDQTRREFIFDNAKIIGVTIGTAVLGEELLLPQVAEAEDVQFPESSCDSKNKDGHITLITYASEFGTTGEVAVAIGDVLCQEGKTVETKWVKNVKDINNYDEVIIGSAIHNGNWMSDAIEFVTDNQHILSKLPVAYFFTCIELSKRNEKAERKAMEYSDKLHALSPQVKPVSVGRFAGVMDYSKMSFFYRQIAKVICLTVMRVKEGDYRDWDAIHAWAKDTQLKLNLVPK